MPLRSEKLLPVAALATMVAAFAGERGAASRVTSSTAMSCSMGIEPGARDSLNNTLVLGRASNDTVAVSPNVVDQWTRPGPDHPMYGQLVRVTSMLGPGAEPTRRAFRAQKSADAVIVPWGNSPGCSIYVWRYSALWTTPDSSGLYSVRLRAESLWAGGRPTFDAFYAGNYSYVIGPYTAGPHFAGFDATGARVTKPSMTPAEVFALYSALSMIKGPGDSIGLSHARTWVRANASILTRYPAELILPRWSLDPR